MRFAGMLLAALFVASAFGATAKADWDVGDPYKMHYPQLPDINGWDIDMQEYRLADDFLCTQTGPITDVHFWCSWADDRVTEIEAIHVSLHRNLSAAENPFGAWSMPGDLICEFSLSPGEFTIREWDEQGPQGWIWPAVLPYYAAPGNHFRIFQVNITGINLPDFRQEEGEIYWLDLQVNTGSILGWKSSVDHYEDDAVWIRFNEDDVPYWQPLVDPITGASMDLAFVITPEPATMALVGLGLAGLLVRRRRKGM